MQRVEDITQALWCARVSPNRVSELNPKIYAQIENWCNQPIGRAPSVCVSEWLDDKLLPICGEGK